MIVKVVRSLGYSVGRVCAQDGDDGGEHLETVGLWPVLKKKNISLYCHDILKEEWGLIDALPNTS